MTTGQAHILNSRQKLEAKHKKGHTFRIHLMVNRVEGQGEVNFMGVLREDLEDDSAIAAVTPSGAVKTANKRLLELCGLDDEAEIVGKNFRALVSAASAEALQECIARVVKTGEEVERFLEGRGRDGRVFPASFLFLQEKGGGAIGAVIKARAGSRSALTFT